MYSRCAEPSGLLFIETHEAKITVSRGTHKEGKREYSLLPDESHGSESSYEEFGEDQIRWDDEVDQDGVGWPALIEGYVRKLRSHTTKFRHNVEMDGCVCMELNGRGVDGRFNDREDHMGSSYIVWTSIYLFVCLHDVWINTLNQAWEIILHQKV